MQVTKSVCNVTYLLTEWKLDEWCCWYCSLYHHVGSTRLQHQSTLIWSVLSHSKTKTVASPFTRECTDFWFALGIFNHQTYVIGECLLRVSSVQWTCEAEWSYSGTYDCRQKYQINNNTHVEISHQIHWQLMSPFYASNLNHWVIPTESKY